jgi:hypothetical protein
LSRLWSGWELAEVLVEAERAVARNQGLEVPAMQRQCEQHAGQCRNRDRGAADDRPLSRRRLRGRRKWRNEVQVALGFAIRLGFPVWLG